MKIDVIATIIKREMLEIFIHKVMEWFFSANQIFLVAYCQLYITSRFSWPPSFGIIAEAARSEVAMVHNIIKLVHPRLMPTKLSRRWGIIVPAFGVFCSVKIVCIVHKCVMKSITSTRTWGETSVFFHLTVLWRVLSPPKRPSEGLLMIITKVNSCKNYIGLKFGPFFDIVSEFYSK